MTCYRRCGGTDAARIRVDDRGRYREAEEFLLRAFEIAGPANATAVYNLAFLYQQQGRFQEAERLHRLALEQIERMRGVFDPAVAQSLNDLGPLYRSRGRHSRAIDLHEHAGEIRSADQDALQTILERGDFIRPLPEEGPGGAAAGGPPLGGTPAPIETDPAIVAELIARSQASIAAVKREIRADRHCSTSSWRTSGSCSGSCSVRRAVR
jgi:tetratricopeptide (TPR) repeat protein